jgi:hypothetical protein
MCFVRKHVCVCVCVLCAVLVYVCRFFMAPAGVLCMLVMVFLFEARAISDNNALHRVREHWM